jgi:hypothetical protein
MQDDQTTCRPPAPGWTTARPEQYRWCRAPFASTIITARNVSQPGRWSKDRARPTGQSAFLARETTAPAPGVAVPERADRPVSSGCRSAVRALRGRPSAVPTAARADRLGQSVRSGLVEMDVP